MNATDLRASILQAAIEGKLVPQLESEPEVEQIGEVSEEVPFEIPKKWKWLRLAFLVEKARQKVPDKTFYYVDVSSVSSGKGLIGKMAIIEAKQAPSRARKIVEEGMVLFSTVRPYLKNVCLALKIPKETIASTAFATFSCSAYLNNRFALYVLTSPYFMNYVAQVQKGIAYPAISDKDFYSAYIPVPPLAEQHRIVARLNELLPLVDDFGEAQEAFTIAQTEFPGKLKASLLQAAIEGKLVPQLESEPEVEQIGETPEDVPFTIPLKWKWKPIGDITIIVAGQSPKGESLNELGEGIEFHQGKTDFSERTIRASTKFTTQPLKISEANSILMSVRAPVGDVNLCDRKLCIGRGLFSIKPRKNVDLEFLFAYLKTTKKHLESLATGTTFKAINGKVVRELFVPVPPLAEQCRIVARLNKLLASINQLGD